MSITFAPKRGAILMCDFDMAYVDPEMRKVRQALVISIKSNNHRHALLPGTCTVIPFTTVQPSTIGPDDVHVAQGTYWSLSEECWLRCKMITTVSHSRLNLVVRNHRRHPSEFVSEEFMKRVEQGIRFALGL